MKNILLCCAWSDPWISTIENVGKHTSINVQTIIAWRDDAEKFKKAFPNAELLIVEDMWLSGRVENEDYSAHYSISNSQKIIAHMMLRRQKTIFFENDFAISDFLFSSLCSFWAVRISKIDLVISPSIPHRFFDYALYIVAKDLGVKVLTFQMLPFGSRVIPLNDIDKMPEKSPKKGNQDFSSIILEETAKTRLEYRDAIPDYMRKHANERKLHYIIYRVVLKALKNLNRRNIYKFRYPNTYKIMFGSFPGRRKPTWSRFIFDQVLKHFKLEMIKREYKSLARKPKLNKEYILFALHYQPEETSCPSAGLYCDQLLALRKLSSLISDHFTIYVKEHSAQFDSHQEGDRGRNKSFYNAIRAMEPRVVLIDESIDTFTLIKHSKAVSTLTGTIGWESIMRKKPVVTFGRSWYEHHPDNLRVYSYTDTNEVLNHILGERKTVDWTSSWLSAFLSTSLHCKHYKGWVSRSDVSFDASVKNLSELVLDQLNAPK